MVSEHPPRQLGTAFRVGGGGGGSATTIALAESITREFLNLRAADLPLTLDLRCVGVASTATAVKAFAVARGHLTVHGLDVIATAHFESAPDETGRAPKGELSVLVLRLESLT